ncbi:MAG: hypothetical protein ACRD2Z_01275 [Thermoanaerobaculia bacterium]
MSKKPETLKIVYTEGGYAVFIYPSPQPAAVFSSGLELLDWVAQHIAGWEAGRQDAAQADAANEIDAAETPKSSGSNDDDEAGVT